MGRMKPGLINHLTNVGSDRVGRKVGCNVEYPVTTYVIRHRDRLTEVSIELWEGGLEVG
jgi:hypothetical protein